MTQHRFPADSMTRWADHVIVVGQPCLEVLLGRGARRDRMSVVLNTPPCEARLPGAPAKPVGLVGWVKGSPGAGERSGPCYPLHAPSPGFAGYSPDVPPREAGFPGVPAKPVGFVGWVKGTPGAGERNTHAWRARSF